MTKFSYAERADARARNEAAAHAIAACAGWRLERPPHLPPGVRRQVFYITAAELLLAPLQSLGGPSSGPVSYAMRTARSDALVVGVGSVTGRLTSVYAAVGLWSRPEPAWHTELRMWCSPSDELWAASEPHVPSDIEVAFRLAQARLRPCGPPWAGDAERDIGFARADRLLLGSRHDG